MAFDFPNVPTNGQTVTTPVGAIYTWDTVKWLASTTSAAPPYLPLAGGDVTGTIGVGAARPGDALAGTVLPARLVMPIDGNITWNAYWTGSAWKTRAAGFSGSLNVEVGDGAFRFYIAPSVAAGAAPVYKMALALTQAGHLVGSTSTAPPADASAPMVSMIEYTTPGQGHYAFNAYVGTTGGVAWKALTTGYGANIYQASAGNVALSLFGTANAGASFGAAQLFNFGQDGSFTAPGSVWAANLPGSFGLQNFGGGWWGLRFQSDGWRLQWNTANGDLQFVNDTSSPRFTCYSSGVFTTAGYINAGGVDGNGYAFTSSAGGAWLNGQIYAQTNVTAGGTVQGAYIHSTQDVRADSYVYGNRIVSNTGIFQVAEGYNLSRNSSDGRWIFYEGGTWNCQISTGGDVSARGTVYGNGHVFSYNNVYALNDWSFYFGGGGSGKIFQFQGSWYWDWASASGNLIWFRGGGTNWVQHSNSSCYNNENWVGGHGWVDLSDERLKQDITPDSTGLDVVTRLRPIRFRRKGQDREEIGFSAQQVQSVIPEAVIGTTASLTPGGPLENEPTTLGVATGQIIAVLVNAVKTLDARLGALEAKP
jgi:hypothetical protein